MISTRNLARLPPPGRLRQVMQALATLDAILCSEWVYRHYSFKSPWNAAGDAVASMRDGSGNGWFALFTGHGVILKGFDKDAYFNPLGQPPFQPTLQRGVHLYPGLLHGFPAALESFLTEPAFSMAETTFVLWRLAAAEAWSLGNLEWPTIDELVAARRIDADGSRGLLGHLAGVAQDYAQWAESRYEVPVDPWAVHRVMNLRPIDNAILRALSCDRGLDELRADLVEIGYPQPGLTP